MGDVARQICRCGNISWCIHVFFSVIGDEGAKSSVTHNFKELFSLSSHRKCSTYSVTITFQSCFRGHIGISPRQGPTQMDTSSVTEKLNKLKLFLVAVLQKDTPCRIARLPWCQQTALPGMGVICCCFFRAHRFQPSESDEKARLTEKSNETVRGFIYRSPF